MTVFVDESSQTAHRYLGLGGLVLENTNVSELDRRLRVARLPDLPLPGEIGWTKVSRAKLDAYKRYTDVFFESGTLDSPLEFHVLIVDTHQINDRAFNKGSREIGFNKEVYQLCTKIGRRLYGDRLFHIYPDKRSTKSKPEELRDILNHGARRRNDPRDWPFRRLHFRDSAESLPLQLTDVLLGAVMFRLNGHYDAPNASEAKRQLSDHVLGRAGIQRVDRDTAMAGKFTLWHRRLR
ncbi:MAG: DUF3800 domain-containing protein [Hyphomonadaceae bacterium]